MYLAYFVQLHGIAENTDPEKVQQQILKALFSEMQPESETDIEVTLEESAGT